MQAEAGLSFVGWAINISDDVLIHFHVAVVPTPVRIGDMQVQAMLPRFAARADEDDWPLRPVENDCWNIPVAFHAGLRAYGQLFTAYHGKGLLYEGDGNTTINVRQVLQTYAALYGVDPNEIAAMYPTCRQWLGHTKVTLPATLDTLVANTKLSATTKKVLH